MSHLDRSTARRFKTLVTPFFTSERKWVAWGMVVLLFGLSLSVNAIGVKISYIARDFMNALSLRDSEGFYTNLLWYLGAFAVATPIAVSYTYTEQRLSLAWRRWLSHFTLQRYFEDQSYYRINLRAEIDNPDQRIEEDVRSFCQQTLSFSLIIFNSVLQILLYIWVLGSISVQLLFIAFGYALLGSITTYFLGRPLIGLNFAQLRKEADYRYKLVNVRDSAESIAFLRDEKKELRRTRQRLKTALKNLHNVINWNRNLQFFTTGYNYILLILPTVIVAPLFFQGKIEFGEVIQAAAAFGTVINALSIVVNHFGNISIYVAVINRLGSFWEALDRSRRQEGGIVTTIGDELKFSNVTIYTPNREQALVKNLSFDFTERSLLLSGTSGSGKTSTLRVIAGLWNTGEGEIVRPSLDSASFVPQRPYTVLGSLRAQLMYGMKGRSLVDRELDEVLEIVRLKDVVERAGGLDAVLDWPQVLGTGELQRLAFARVLLARPKIVFLDEATTAIDRAMEEELYAALPRFVDRFVSTGNRATLSQFHDKVLELQVGGTWRFSK